MKQTCESILSSKAIRDNINIGGFTNYTEEIKSYTKFRALAYVS